MEENETKNGLTRRSFLSTSAVGAIGLAAAGFTAGALLNPREAHAAVLTFPQPDVLDVGRIRDLAFYWYKKGPGCGHGSARGLIQGFCEASELQFGVGFAGGWADINRNLYAWCNSGGPGGFGALCGSIAGAVGVMNLIGRQNDIGRAVFEWYVQQPFPGNLDSLKDNPSFDGSALFVTGGTANTGHGASGSGQLGGSVPIPFAENKAALATDSPLCHVSVSKWMAAAGVKHGELDSLGRDIRGDRCAKVTAETAAECARLYNLFKASGVGAIAAWAKPDAMASCYDCHDTNNTSLAANPPLSNRSTQTKMSCLPCHTEPVSGRKP